MAFDKNGQGYFVFEELTFDEMCADLDKRKAFYDAKFEANTISGRFKSLSRFHRLMDYNSAVMRRVVVMNNKLFEDFANELGELI